MPRRRCTPCLKIIAGTVGHKYQHIIPKLVADGITVEHLYTHDIGFIADLLGTFNVDSKGARMKLVSSAARLTNVVYLQVRFYIFLFLFLKKFAGLNWDVPSTHFVLSG